jgi:hypothetical protein
MQQTASVTRKELLAQAEKEPFAHVLEQTPKDVFGRVLGKHCITASNVAKYEALHGLVVAEDPDPLSFTEEETVDRFQTAMRWLAEAHAHDEEALYPVVAWNCLWKAGASLVHAHLQMVLGRGTHYAAVEKLKAASDAYRKRHRKDYFAELVQTHKDLGLGTRKDGVNVFASVTPRKEMEVVMLAPAADAKLFSAIHRVARAFIDGLGVESFNVAVLLPPLDSSWKGFPVVARIVDRGALSAKTTDVAFMELYLDQNVVSSDPVKVWDAISRKM